MSVTLSPKTTRARAAGLARRTSAASVDPKSARNRAGLPASGPDGSTTRHSRRHDWPAEKGSGARSDACGGRRLSTRPSVSQCARLHWRTAWMLSARSGGGAAPSGLPVSVSTRDAHPRARKRSPDDPGFGSPAEPRWQTGRQGQRQSDPARDGRCSDVRGLRGPCDIARLANAQRTRGNAHEGGRAGLLGRTDDGATSGCADDQVPAASRSPVDPVSRAAPHRDVLRAGTTRAPRVHGTYYSRIFKTGRRGRTTRSLGPSSASRR